jgi:4a-hydroxytetrahydrobiopterin dehydratase
MDFASRHCVPCEAGTPRKTAAEVDAALPSLPGWAARDAGTRLHRQFRFKDFVEAMRFVNALAAVAEQEQHHPDFTVHWNTVDVVLWTHTVGGLSDNDLILAAKLDHLPEAGAAKRG